MHLKRTKKFLQQYPPKHHHRPCPQQWCPAKQNKHPKEHPKEHRKDRKNHSPIQGMSLLLYIIDTSTGEQHAISVPPAATVARAKAAFLRARVRQSNSGPTLIYFCKFSTHLCNHIFFLHSSYPVTVPSHIPKTYISAYRGETLVDERPLISYGINDSDTIHHVAIPGSTLTGSGYHYYTQLDREIAASNRHRNSTTAPPSPTRTEWGDMPADGTSATHPTAQHSHLHSRARSNSWQHLSFSRNANAKEDAATHQRFQLTNSPKITQRTQWAAAKNDAENFDKRKSAASRRSNFGAIQEEGRMFVPRHTCRVSGMLFSMIHRLEGRWTGIIQNSTEGDMLSSSEFSFVRMFFSFVL